MLARVASIDLISSSSSSSCPSTLNETLTLEPCTTHWGMAARRGVAWRGVGDRSSRTVGRHRVSPAMSSFLLLPPCLCRYVSRFARRRRRLFSIVARLVRVLAARALMRLLSVSLTSPPMEMGGNVSPASIRSYCSLFQCERTEQPACTAVNVWRRGIVVASLV